jgi:hypothetical protein
MCAWVVWVVVLVGCSHGLCVAQAPVHGGAFACRMAAPSWNTRTDRIRKLVMESGPARLSWLDYERDIREDFRRVFGREPGRLLPVALMSDGDNTSSQFRAWHGPVQLHNPDLVRRD